MQKPKQTQRAARKETSAWIPLGALLSANIYTTGTPGKVNQ